MSDIYRMPGHLIRRVHQISTALFLEECGSDLTSVQFAALSMIQKHSNLDATRLAGLIAFDRSTIGDVLERLEAKGWIKRRESSSDRRTKLLSLTPSGSQLLRQILPAVRRVQERLLAPLAAKEAAILVHLLTELAELHEDATL
jgi:DNA-binding MarR family transcriptional regulator